MTNVHAIHFDADEKLVSLIKEKSEKLHHFNDTITSIDVYLKLESGSQHIKDKTVEIKINILKHQIFVKHTSKTFEESLKMSLESVVTKLKKEKELLKG